MPDEVRARRLRRVSDVESARRTILPSLQETRAAVTLAPAKPSGLADLGAPLVDGTMVKKGRVHEFQQLLADGQIGRRFQDLRVVAVKTVEGDIATAKVFVQFEAFGDNTVAPTDGVGFEAALFDGAHPLASFTSSALFIPYAGCWYPNCFVFETPIEVFDLADRLDFIARPDDVRLIQAAN
jgi:hypothetical protein